MGATAVWIATATAAVAVAFLAVTLARIHTRANDRAYARRSAELDERDERLSRRESTVETKAHTLELRESNLIERERGLAADRADLDDDRIVVRKRLEEIADYSADEARQALLEQVEAEARADARDLVRDIQSRAQQEATRRAHDIVASAIQRVAPEATRASATSTVELAEEELKGRIIGRDGRNIKTFEAATGVNLVIDDTPSTVTVSSFDPVRREVARIALERLVADGRIHPSQIEEMVGTVRAELDQTMLDAAQEAVNRTGLQGVDPELMPILGRLRFRHSYGQNILQHSVEMAHLMGMMAAELGLDPALAKRVGLFHDIGKAVDHEVEGGHALIGADILKRHGERPEVVNAVASHHRDVPAETPYAHLCVAADAITASRPGARAETTDIYLKRLEKLEEIANGFPGVGKSYALQAGREIRVFVEPGQVTDEEGMTLARQIAKRIESELDYPGQIKVTLIRETRCVEYAR